MEVESLPNFCVITHPAMTNLVEQPQATPAPLVLPSDGVWNTVKE